MTFTELFYANEETQYPSVSLIGIHYWLGFPLSVAYLTETEAALLCARLLAILPAATASEAVALSESIRRDATVNADA